MRRRDLLKSLVVLGVGSVVAPTFVWGCHNVELNNGTLSEQQLLLLEEIADTIIPRHKKMPGAKDAKVAAFMAGHIKDCYTLEERKDLIKSILAIDETADRRFGKPFAKLGNAQKQELLKAFDRGAKNNKDSGNIAYVNYAKLKSLIVFGFFTSEIGATQCLRYLPIPGYYKGEIAYKKGDKAWALN